MSYSAHILINRSKIHLHVEQLSPEYLRNAGRRPQTSKRTSKSPSNWVGQKKREKERQTGPVHLGWSCEKGKVSKLGRPFTGKVISWDRRGASEPQRRVQQTVCIGQSRESPAETVGAPT